MPGVLGIGVQSAQRPGGTGNKENIMKAIKSSSVQLSKQQANEILVKCMTSTPKIDAETLLMSAPFERPGIDHDLYIGRDSSGQMYLRCQTLPKSLWSATFGNGV
jgi:hypothetical protein